jgi:DNA polymerase III subunit delta'
MSQRIFDSITGHKLTIKRLLHMLESGRLPNSLLFVGPQGQGKKKVALGLAQALLCDRSRSACGECPSCIGVYKMQSPGLIVLTSEGGPIKIEAARQVIEQLSLATWGRGRVVLIDEAEKLNPQAANSLLKSIEEPPERTHFILTAASQESVLKTIYSRSQVIRFRNLNREELAEITGQSVSDPELVDSTWQVFGQIWRESDTSVVTQSARVLLTDRERALQVLELWREFTRDIWLSKNLKKVEFIHSAKKSEYQDHQVTSEARLADFAELLQAAENDLLGNCDMQLTVENLILETRRGFQ